MPPTIEANPYLSASMNEAVRTTVDDESPVNRQSAPNAKWRAAWQEWIERTLINWLSDPTQLEEDGSDAPTGTVIRLAMDYAAKFRDDRRPPPDSIVPDPSGGIVFERQGQQLSEVFHFWDDGAVEYCEFHGTQLVERWQV